MSDIVSACCSFLLSKADVVSKFGSDDDFPAWIFDRTLYVRYEGTSQVALVISTAGGTDAAQGSWAEYPRLQLDYYADPKRLANGFVQENTAVDKIMAAHAAVDKYLHRKGSESEFWTPSVRVHASRRDGYPEFYPLSDTDGSVLGRVFYSLGVG